MTSSSQNFDPAGIGLLNGNIYGLPFTLDEAQVVVVPVPWDVTVSYREGAHGAPQAMLDASVQVDLFDEDMPDVWKVGVAMEPISEEWMERNKKLRAKAIDCLDHLAEGGSVQDEELASHYAEINAAGEELNHWVQNISKTHLDAGKAVCILGGEHSVSLGLIRELARRHEKFSILHIDAHADLRDAYEGFTYSHASIMFNARQLEAVEKLTVLAIRDYCQDEADLIRTAGRAAESDGAGSAHGAASKGGPITAFTDRQLKRAAFDGVSWKEQCAQIVETLGDKVYISFDIDALDPSLCPHTGTPVPGGLEYEQVLYLVDELVKSGRTILGFDLSEVAPGVVQPGDMDSWDAVVGVRLLYRLVNQMARSQKRI
ncbi:agmatinase [Candidatus Peregrinibacteria bacterium CG_4_9_14_0_2_um_filter_53_11]|nr:MAG: agmatinase [Candidatus Peregrinibacteria bacterium CG_4_9_14_0_2_um_filter_53_11]